MASLSTAGDKVATTRFFIPLRRQRQVPIHLIRMGFPFLLRHQMGINHITRKTNGPLARSRHRRRHRQIGTMHPRERHVLLPKPGIDHRSNPGIATRGQQHTATPPAAHQPQLRCRHVARGAKRTRRLDRWSVPSGLGKGLVTLPIRLVVIFASAIPDAAVEVGAAFGEVLKEEAPFVGLGCGEAFGATGFRRSHGAAGGDCYGTDWRTAAGGQGLICVPSGAARRRRNGQIIFLAGAGDGTRA
mmetsp:Transcript_40050/g.86369  ORF Transcript_40050/g.86369 Transcript_40050/m.86369 type:complete len:244 (+) Transcript_40050:181-912(+)